jgi:transposase
MSRQRGQKGAERSGARALARGLLDQDTSEDRFRWGYLAFNLSGGEKADAPLFPVLLDLGPDINPRAAIGDKGYDSKANRNVTRERGIAPVIPCKSNARNRPAYFPKALYKARARIEQAVGKLKRFKRVALRCEKTARNFMAFVQLSAGFILLQSVHTA